MRRVIACDTLDAPVAINWLSENRQLVAHLTGMCVSLACVAHLTGMCQYPITATTRRMFHLWIDLFVPYQSTPKKKEMLPRGSGGGFVAC